MLLQNKNVIIYGAGGSLGAAVAKAMAAQGAELFLTGHRIESVQKLTDDIKSIGGKAEAAEVDAMNTQEVDEHIQGLLKRELKVDVVFNAIGWQDKQNIPLTEMAFEDFIRPVTIAMTTQFITSTAAARVMMGQKSGVILSLTATPGGIGYANVGGFGPACSVVEAFSRNLASEVGSFGVRVVNIRSGGSPDSKVFKEAIAQGGERVKDFLGKMTNDTMLKRLPLMKDIAATAVFLASDMAAAITGCTVDATCGTTAALNYKVTPIAFVQ